MSTHAWPACTLWYHSHSLCMPGAHGTLCAFSKGAPPYCARSLAIAHVACVATVLVLQRCWCCNVVSVAMSTETPLCCRQQTLLIRHRHACQPPPIARVLPGLGAKHCNLPHMGRHGTPPKGPTSATASKRYKVYIFNPCHTWAGTARPQVTYQRDGEHVNEHCKGEEVLPSRDTRVERLWLGLRVSKGYQVNVFNVIQNIGRTTQGNV